MEDNTYFKINRYIYFYNINKIIKYKRNICAYNNFIKIIIVME